MNKNNINTKTKIIFTIGPATESIDMIVKLILSGVNVCRLNMAHASHIWTINAIKNIRKASSICKKEIAIMMDIKGPEIRTGFLKNPLKLKQGDHLNIYMSKEHMIHSDLKNSFSSIYVNYPDLIKDVNINDTLLLDSGFIQLKVINKKNQLIECIVLIPNTLSSYRHINLPGVLVNLPAITEKDKTDIDLAIKKNIDFIALSFVRHSNDILILRKILNNKNSKVKIIAKLEDQASIINMEEIIEESDGVMVARGDLGIECLLENIPIIQKKVVLMSKQYKKPVIIATHMLESMIQNSLPSRAEASDVANAVDQQVDAIMLSAETAIGKFPIECIHMMKKIAYTIEKNAFLSYNTNLILNNQNEKILKAAITLSQDLNQSSILIFDSDGLLTNTLSSLRPIGCKIFAFTDNILISKQMNLLWGVNPFLIKFSKKLKKDLQKGLKILLEYNLIQIGEKIVLIDQINQTIKVHCIK